MKKISNNNAGFSLIEMVVAVLIASLLMLGVAAFVSTSRYTYSKVSTEARLQEEATAATNFLNELLIESKQCGSGTVNDSASGKTLDYIWIKALQDDPSAVDAKKIYTYFIVFEKPDTASGETSGVLRFKKVLENDSGKLNVTINASTGKEVMTISNATSYFSDVVGNKYAFICRCVTEMTLNSVKSTNGYLHKVNLSFKYNGKDFSATVNNLSRNKASN